MLKRAFPLLVLVVAAGCGDDPTSSVPTAEGLVLRVQVSPEAAARLTTVRGTLYGPDTAQVTLAPAEGGVFTGSAAVAPGTYTIMVQGLVGGELDHLGIAREVRFAGAGTASVPFASFVPAVAPVLSPTTGTAVALAFPAIPAADGFEIEFARTPTFQNPAVQTAAAPVVLQLPDTGTFHFRVRAVSGLAGSGAASAPGTVRVLTDSIPVGDQPAAARPLGFGVDANGTYGGLNVLPAGDADWFAVGVCRDDLVSIRVAARAGGTPSALRPALEVRDGRGATISLQNGATGGTAAADVLLARQDTLYIGVSGGYQTVGSYELDVTVLPGPGGGTGGCATPEISFDRRMNAGAVHVCSVSDGGQAYCWGDNAFGQLGDGTHTAHPEPVAVGGGITFQSISAGWEHSCGVSTSYDAYCWGRNDDGRLGDGSRTTSGVPVPVAGGHKFVAVGAGVYHSCGLTTQGTVLCWGSNAEGRLGTRNISGGSLVPVPIEAQVSFRDLSVGFRHACGVARSGALYCWGGDSLGQIGNGPAGDQFVPLRVDGGRTFSQVSAGYEHTCGVTTAGEGFCWGYNRIGQLGNGSNSNTVPVQTPQPVLGGHTFTAIAAAFGADSIGGHHSCGVTPSGEVYCWGLNQTGQIGDVTGEMCDKPDVIDTKQFACATVPTRVNTGLTFASVTAGQTHACGVATDGRAYCWGDRQMGQAGTGVKASSLPQRAAVGITVKEIVGGGFHTCAITPDGTTYCWGWNTNGQLGDGTYTTALSPVLTQNGMKFSTIATGIEHTCGTTLNGMGYCWGKGANGQLGGGSMTSSLTAVPVVDTAGFMMITAGDAHTCGIGAADSLAYCWGHGGEGRLGTGGSFPSSVPVRVAGAHQYTWVSAGNLHACGAATDGALWCWGYNSNGQIGNGAGATNDFSPEPDSVLTSLRFVQTTTGFYHTCGLAANGEIFCWGSNQSGQLGDGTLDDHKVPIHVAEGLQFKEVTAGFYHSCGLTQGGEVYCWGDNHWGQLGNGETADRWEPVRVETNVVFDKLFSGDDFNCAVTASGETYCWGRNCRGQLGLGYAGISLTPNPVAGSLTFTPGSIRAGS